MIRVRRFSFALGIALLTGVSLGIAQLSLQPSDLGPLQVPLVSADTCVTTCCFPAHVTIHTNATAGNENGPFRLWSSPHEGRHVPVEFEAIYERCGQSGSQTIAMPGSLTEFGTLIFTPPSGFSSVAPCSQSDFPSSIVTLVAVCNMDDNRGPCATAGRTGLQVPGGIDCTSTCFTDTDWQLDFARRVAGPPSGGNMFGTSWKFVAVKARIAPSADTLFLQSPPGASSCENATDRALTSNSWRFSTQTGPGGQIICEGEGGIGGLIDLCLYAAFN